MKSWLLPRVALGVLLLGVAGCGGSSTVTVVVTATPPKPATRPTAIPQKALTLPTATATAQVVSQPTATTVPQTVAVNGNFTDTATGMQVILKSPILNAAGDSYYQPDKGKVFLIIYASIHNNSASPHSYNPLDFTAVDEQGQTYDETIELPQSFSPTLADSGAMAGHDLRSGYLGFQIPMGKHTITIDWDNASTLDPPAKIAHYTVNA